MSSTTNKRALIIGIDQYNQPIGSLSGCVNDARLMESVLVSAKFGVPQENVVFLADGAATRQGILNAFDALIAATEPGDMVVIFYAGHGSRVADRNMDEADGHDSTIVPTDAKRWSSPEEFADNPEVLDITDDEIHVKLLRLSDKTDNITMVFDSCHSGTISRGPSDLVARHAPEDRRPAELLEPMRFSPEDQARLEAANRSGSGWLSPGDRYVLIAGCQDSEQSYEQKVPDSDPPVKHGALTYFLTQALLQAAPGTTYRDVFDQVALQVTTAARALSANQHPQIEGAANRLLFNTEEIEPLAFVRITDVNNGQVTLAGGAAHGLRVGSEWGVYPQGTREATDENRLGLLKITSVGAVQSSAQVVADSERESGTITVGAWAVEGARDFGDRRLKVSLSGDREAAPAAWDVLVNGLEGRPRTLEKVDGADESVKVILVPAGSTIPELPTLPPQDAPRVVVVSEAGQFMMPPKPADPEGVKQVLENLDLWSQYRFRLAVDNPNSRLAKQVSVEVVRRNSGGDWEPVRAAPDQALALLIAGDHVDIRLVNRGINRVYVTGFDFRMTGEIAPIGEPFWLHPATPEHPYLSLTGDQGTPLSWEEGFPFSANPWVASPSEGVEVLKFFLTQQETHFNVSQSSASRGGGSDALAELLASPGAASRGFSVVSADDWGTVSFAFNLRAGTDGDGGGGPPSGGRTPRGDDVVTGGVRPGGAGEPTGTRRRPDWSEETPAGRLRALMSEQGISTVGSFTVGGPGGTGAASRGAADPAGFEFAPLDEGFGEVLLSTDDAGLVQWHLPLGGGAAESVASRGADGHSSGGRGAPARRRYQIDPPTSLAASDRPATRGPLGAVLGKLFVDRLAFPILDPLVAGAAGLWEAHRRPDRVRWLGPSDLGSKEVRPVEADDWSTLAEGPALLLLHGPFSRADRAFRDLTPEFLQGLSARYGNRIFAFDHPTVSKDPFENAQALIAGLPEGIQLDLDVLGHSRGGLVARALVERAGELGLGDRQVRVRRLVLTGSPNGGTPLADTSHVDALLSVFTNIFALVDPSELAGTVLELLKKVAVGGASGLTGIQAMVPDSAFLQTLTPATRGETLYYGIASDVSSSAGDGWLRKILDRQVGKIMPGANDLVVTESSAWGEGIAEGLPLEGRLTLTGADAVSHLGYFQRDSVRRQLAEWLLRDGGALAATPSLTPDLTPPAPRIAADPESASRPPSPPGIVRSRPPRPPGAR